MSSFWTLPGPAHFIENIAAEARAGNSVLIAVPEYHPGFLSGAVRAVIAHDYSWQYLSIDADVRPSEFLFSYCLPDSHPQIVRTVQTLISQPEFRGKAIWLDGLKLQGLESWSEFLLEYAHLARSIPPVEQTVLLVPAQGQVAGARLPQEAGLSVVFWKGWMDRLDIDLHAAIQVGRRVSGLEKQLVVAIAAELGGTDEGLTTFLAGLELDQLLSPMGPLRSFAADRMWLAESEGKEWWTGKVYDLEGEQIDNAALLALEGKNDEIDQLIWRAEVRTLFPVIEYHRQRFVHKYARLLTVYKDEYETYDVPDLEIYMLKRQLSRNSGVDTNDLALLGDLQKARNALAHLRVVEPSIVLKLSITTPNKFAVLAR